MRSLSRLALACAVALIAGTTSSGCRTAHSAVETVSAVAADALLPPSEEEKLGDQLAAQIADEVEMHKDASVQRYVDRLGNRIVRAARARGEVPEGIDFDFHVVDNDEEVNAFAIPGGDIYLYSGLLKAAESEAEVAGVLAHEVAHVTQRHIAERLVAQYGLSAIAGLALGQDPGMLQQIAAQLLGTGALLKFSRDHETEADSTAIPYLVRAGYNPIGLADFFERMVDMSGEVPGVLEFLQSHPAPQDRLEIARSRAATVQDAPEYLGAREYAAFKRGV